jgi:hypothetical protein
MNGVDGAAIGGILGFCGLLTLLGFNIYQRVTERRRDRLRWKTIADLLVPRNYEVFLNPNRSDLPLVVRINNFLEVLGEVAWQPHSRLKRICWVAEGVDRGRLVQLTELELTRPGDKNVYAESFLLTAAPPHWPAFLLLRKPDARKLARAVRLPVSVRWRVLTTSTPLLFWSSASDRRAKALRSPRLAAELESFPPDEQWFVRDGQLCCHWSEPLDDDRVLQMLDRVETFIALMEVHMLRLPREM